MKLMSALDHDSDGTIDFEEFTGVCAFLRALCCACCCAAMLPCDMSALPCYLPHLPQLCLSTCALCCFLLSCVPVRPVLLCRAPSAPILGRRLSWVPLRQYLQSLTPVVAAAFVIARKPAGFKGQTGGPATTPEPPAARHPTDKVQWDRPSTTPRHTNHLQKGGGRQACEFVARRRAEGAFSVNAITRCVGGRQWGGICCQS